MLWWDCGTTAPGTLEELPATELGHAVSKSIKTTQGVEHRQEPLSTITQFFEPQQK